LNNLRETFIAVVVTYNPNFDFVENLNALLSFYPHVIIVDNTEKDEPQIVLDQFSTSSCVSIFKNRKNIGIAEALNIGTKEAKNFGAKWVTTFDQDSRLFCDLPEIIKSHYRIINEYEFKIIIGADFIDPIQKNEYKNYNCSTINLISAEELISSGMTYPITVFDSVNGFDKDFFIDMVDHDYCIKAKLKGIQLFKTSVPVMLHSVGAKTKHSLFGKTLYTNNHSSLRRYYYARNTIVVFKKYFFLNFFKSCKHVYRLLKLILLVVLFENKKIEKMLAISKGFMDGFLGRLGRHRNRFF
jgi:rhamnosyltransferase